MNVEDVQTRLNCDRKTVLGLLGNGTIPAAKIGKAWVIREADVEAFLDEQVRKQTAKRRHEANPPALDITIVAQEARQASDGRRRRRNPLPRLPQLPG